MKRNVKIISKICIFLLVSTLLIGTLSGCNLFKKKLKYDEEAGVKAVTVVNNAQYKPDLDKFKVANSSDTMPLSYRNLATIEENDELTIQEFNALVDKYATIESYSGAGKYLGYDIHEIKAEIAYVVDQVPAFEQWFKLPSMRNEQGFISIPYNEGWKYYVEWQGEMLSITRVCNATRSSYLDFNRHVSIEKYYDEEGLEVSAFVQYEVMKTNYYLDKNGDEVVECYIYTVGVDKAVVVDGGRFNENETDYHPFEYQYLKNVKDKQFMKYHITASPRYSEDSSFGFAGMDIRGLTPYGIRRELMIVDYNGYKNVEVLDIDQRFATLDNSDLNGAVDFDTSSNSAKALASFIGLDATEYEKIDDAKQLMDLFAHKEIDDFELKNEWKDIYSHSNEAIEAEAVEGPFYGKEMPIKDLNLYVSCRSHKYDEIEFNAYANVTDKSKINANDSYSLSMALRNKKTGKLHIIADKYQKVEEVEYNYGPWYEGEKETYWRFSRGDIKLSASKLQLAEEGEYDITCVLIHNGEIMFDTLSVAYLRSYVGLEIADYELGGVTYSYYVSSAGGKITITVTSKPSKGISQQTLSI